MQGDAQLVEQGGATATPKLFMTREFRVVHEQRDADNQVNTDSRVRNDDSVRLTYVMR